MLATTRASTRTSSATPVRGCTIRTVGGACSRRRSRFADARRQLRERPLARGVGLAVGEELVERALRVARGEQRQPHVHRRDAVEDHRADVFAVAAEVDERGARSVRPAVQVDAVVAQIRANLVQVVHGDVGRVEADVGVVARETSLQAVEARLARFGHLAQRVRVRSAVQRIRLPGAALIDEDDVARPLDGAEGRANLARQLRRALAGPAGEEEQRISRATGRTAGSTTIQSLIWRPAWRVRSSKTVRVPQ